MGDVMTFPATVEEFMEQYKVVDCDHVLSNGVEFVPVFRMRQWFEYLQALPITNADRIRSMTDEELANMWYSYVDCGACPMHRECNILPRDCMRFALEWMKQEYTP